MKQEVSDGKQKRRLLIAGGGTGGHVHAGIAVAEAWKARFGTQAEILFVGSARGLEASLVPSAGYPLALLRLGTLNRVSWRQRLTTLFWMPWAMIRSLMLLVTFRPEAVIGVGGYASGPVVFLAAALEWIWGGHTAILEQNSVAGMTNRILGRAVSKVFSAFGFKPGVFSAEKVVVTGNPIRSKFTPRPPAKRRPFHVLIFGGSQGAVGLNSVVIETLEHLRSHRNEITFTHQTGALDVPRVREMYEKNGLKAEVLPFIQDMSSAYERSSLVICRAGASSLAEIAAVGRAAILIPLPTAADNHQEFNARCFSDQGAARLLNQKEINSSVLAQEILRFFEQPELIDEMEQKVKWFYRPNAAQEIVHHLIR